MAYSHCIWLGGEELQLCSLSSWKERELLLLLLLLFPIMPRYVAEKEKNLFHN